jgi:hypothetical protein
LAEKSAREVLNHIGKFLSELTNAQRIWLAIGGVSVAGTLWFFVSMLSAPKYVTLYSGLRAEEAQSLGARLAAKNIAYQLSPDGGSVLVAADKLDVSRLETASQGLPRNARMGFELFDTPNWAGSDFSEKVNYQRALEGELERTLQSLSEVQAVRSVATDRKLSASSGISALAGHVSTSGIQNIFSPSSTQTLSGKSQASTTSSLRTSMAGTIVAVLPSGVLVIEAERQITMNNEKQTLLLRGLVRPGDISPNNVVASNTIGNLELELKGKGVLSDGTRPPNPLVRWILRIVGF